jgi:hypothetical protein
MPTKVVFFSFDYPPNDGGIARLRDSFGCEL